MSTTPVALGRGGSLPDTACFAPSVQLFLNPDGEVTPCARHLRSLGNIGRQRLTEIWDGVLREDLRRALAAGDYSRGCENCGAEVELEGSAHSYSSFFVARAAHLGGGAGADRWPRFIDFNLSNTCNLQCIQCSGELSSSIRIHREKRAPLPMPYGEQFFEDLRLFVPHLDMALFAGGEPFLASENFRVWELIAELRPDLPCTVTTNATQWNRRIEQILELLRFSFVVSIDGITPATYSAIRVGGHLDVVLANVERLRAYARRVGTSVSFNHCLMAQNHHEFADLLVWAERREIDVNVSVVRVPSTCSISHLPAEELAAVHRGLLARDAEMSVVLDRNLATWSAELERIEAWARNAAAPVGQRSEPVQTILGFRREGSGPTDPAAVAAVLAGPGAGGTVHVLQVGSDDRISACSDSVRSALGIDPTELVGRHFDSLQHVSERHFGPVVRHTVVDTTDDRVELEVTYERADSRVVLLADRDAGGRCASGQVLFTVTATQ